MKWFTAVGYDEVEGQNIVVKGRAEDENDFKNRIENYDEDSIRSMEIYALFEGKLDELTGNPEQFELKE